jgi:hypothetical protein
MSALERIAFFQGRRDEVPNQELARQLAGTDDIQGIREIAGHLWDQKSQIQSDCLKVLYEIGYLRPELIAPYAGDFLKLLRSKNNRLVWGSMLALASIARLRAEEIFSARAEIYAAMQKGSVITVDGGVSTLAGVASTDDARRKELLPYLFNHLATCRPKDVPQHAEKVLPAVDELHREAFVAVLEQRLEDLSASQRKRVEKVLRAVMR